MTENKGDLISREALKKAFEETVCIEPMPYAFVKQIIDNAPTVETKTTAECIIAYGDGYETARRLYERPQGEWLEYKEDNEIRYYCSNCHVTKGQAVNNFCACCGADMRGKEE